MVSFFPPTETVTALSFALGGIENVLAVENCLSRLRVFTQLPPPADDKEFLRIGFMGVVRLKNQIHLICGTGAIALRHAFQCLLDAEKDQTALQLLAYAGGYRNVSQLVSSPGRLELRLNSPVDFPPIAGLRITREGLSVFIASESVPAELLSINVQSALMFWDFLYTLNLYRLFKPLGIKGISACRTRLKLKLDSLDSLPFPCPLLALESLPVHEERGEVHILCPNYAEPYAAMLKLFATLYEKKRK